MPSTAETLIFLPGASGNTRFWRPLADRLARGGPRQFVGWPGFGGLPPERGMNGIADLAQLVAKQVTGPTALFAQSMGGVVAVLTALEKPHLVRRMVLSVTSGGIDMAELGAIDWRRAFRTLNPGVPKWFEEERWDLSERLREISIPVLVLWGDADPISPVAVGRRLAELLPNAELVVLPGGTHDLALERVDDILPHVERHLAKPSPV